MSGQKFADFLFTGLNVERYPLIAITGGGGKTSLMFALAALLGDRGRAVSTTTVKIGVPRAGQGGCLFIGDASRAAARIASMPKRGMLTIVKEKRGAKLLGFTPAEVGEILKDGAADWIIAEADGSRRLPFKVYEEWEPPVPELTTLQFVVVGADVFTKPVDEETVFRAELLARRFGVRVGEKLSPRASARVLSSSREYLKNSPPQARRVLFLNKADLLGATERGEVLRGLSEASGFDRLVMASLKKGVVYEALDFNR